MKSAVESDVAVEIGLTAAIVSVDGDNPRILVVKAGSDPRAARAGLPFGMFAPVSHRTLDSGLSRRQGTPQRGATAPCSTWNRWTEKSVGSPGGASVPVMNTCAPLASRRASTLP